MKVIYEKSVLAQIDAAILMAARDNRVIERIEVTLPEWEQLCTGVYATIAIHRFSGGAFSHMEVMGIKIVCTP